MKPVSKTAYYCCGVRMMDALSQRPLVNDIYAKDLMGEEGLKYWEVFKDKVNPNGSNVARCYLIDSWIKEQLQSNPETTVILIGAGLDSRALRIAGGNWIELDEPGVIEYKNIKLPVTQSKNSLQRIGVDFDKESLPDKLAPFAHLPSVVIVVEGVLMYLTRDQKTTLFNLLTTLFKNHILLCDLMSQRFFEKLGSKGIHDDLVKSGATFQDLHSDPARFIKGFGYRQEKSQSNVISASDFGLLSIPRFMVKFVMKKLLMGYSSYQFRFSG